MVVAMEETGEVGLDDSTGPIKNNEQSVIFRDKRMLQINSIL